MIAETVGLTQQDSSNIPESIVAQSDPTNARYNDETTRAVGECHGTCFRAISMTRRRPKEISSLHADSARYLASSPAFPVPVTDRFRELLGCVRRDEVAGALGADGSVIGKSLFPPSQFVVAEREVGVAPDD